MKVLLRDDGVALCVGGNGRGQLGAQSTTAGFGVSVLPATIIMRNGIIRSKGHVWIRLRGRVLRSGVDRRFCGVSGLLCSSCSTEPWYPRLHHMRGT